MLATVAALVVHVLNPTGVLYDASYLAVTVGAAAAAWLGARRMPAVYRRIPQLIAFGLTASAIGDMVYTAYAWGGAYPNFSVADVGWFGSYLGLGAALLFIMLRTGGRSRVDIDALIDVLTIVTVSILVFWTISVDAIVADTSVSMTVRAVWAAYPVADAVLLALVLRALASRASRALLGVPFAVGVTMWLAADLGYLLLTMTDAVVMVLDIGWMLGAALMATAAWRRPPRPVVDTNAAPSASTTVLLGRVSLAVLPLLVPPWLGVLGGVTGSEVGGYQAGIGMVVLVALVFVRTVRLLKSESVAREAARKGRQHYARLAENSSDAVLVLAPDGRATNLSPQLARLVGFRGSSVGQDWAHILSPADPAVLDAAFAEALATPGEPHTVEVQVDHRDGSRVWLSARLVNLVDDPAVHGVIVSLADITDRKHVEVMLEAARDAALEGSRMKSEFLATMSHEIRTPMNGVIGLTGLLLTTDLNERQQQYAQGVRLAGESLLTIINDILDFSKVEAGKLELETIDFSLLQIVEEAAELVAGAAQDKGLELLAYCSPELPMGVRGDPSRLRQVLLNLASNAVKFTDQGEVVVSAHIEDRNTQGVVVRFEVADTGLGIEEEDRMRLFEPFSQADSSTTRRFGGTGLGLAISHRLVHAMGGEIGVTSEPGVGSTFWFTLPLDLAVDQTITPRKRTDPLAGLRVLIVDDNQTNRLILSEQLSAWGMDADVVEDGATALRELAAAADHDNPYALAILDLCMPKMDGLQLARLISADPTLSGIGLVLLTSGPDVSTEEALEVGIGARLTKPVRLSQLETTLQSVRRSARGGAVHVRVPAQSETLPSARGHLLIAEDNSTNQLVAVGILEYLGYTTEVAANGLEVLAALRRRDFDGILMDCQMPEMDGYEATEEIRRIEGELRRTPVIAMTAAAVQGERERCLACGMDDYVSKPVSPEALEAALTRWLPASTT